MSVFDRYYKKYDSWYDKNKFAYLSELETVRKVIPKHGKGLEIGVGTGRFAGPLNISMGIDFSKGMLEIAAQRGVNVRWGFAEDLPFLDATFDYAAIIITLCFVNDPLKVLKEAGRILKRNGKIIIGIIDKDSFLGRYYRKKKSLFYKEANFFGVKELADLLEEAGFNKFSCCQTLFHLPEETSSIEKIKKGFGKGGFVVVSAKKRIKKS